MTVLDSEQNSIYCERICQCHGKGREDTRYVKLVYRVAIIWTAHWPLQRTWLSFREGALLFHIITACQTRTTLNISYEGYKYYCTVLQGCVCVKS